MANLFNKLIKRKSKSHPKTYREKLKTVILTDFIIAFGVFIFVLPINWLEFNKNSIVKQFGEIAVTDIMFSLLASGVILLIYFVRRKKSRKNFVYALHQKQKALKDKNDQLELLMRSSSAVIWRVKVNADLTMPDTCEYINEVLGYTVEEMCTKRFWLDNLHPEDAQDIFAEIPDIFEKGYLSLQYRFKHKDGSWRWMQDNLKCRYDDNKQPFELVGTWWDITKEKEIQDQIKTSNERFELAFKATNDIMYDRNIATNVQWMSDEISKSFGYDKATTSQPLWWKGKIHPDDHERTKQSAKLAQDTKQDVWTGNYRFRRADGTYADITDRRHYVFDNEGQPVRCIGCISDVTILKKTESDLTAALIKANESTKAKSEFLANMSHEIRTPLNGIVGMTDLALDTDLTAEQKRYLETVRLSCNNLMSLINDILDFSKIDAGKLDITPIEFSLRDSMPAILNPLGLKASHKNLEFVFSIEENVPDLLIGDMHRLQQIVTNLAGNAIKFTEKGEVVLHVEMRSLHNEDAEFLFSVTDTGIGIAEHNLNSVFEEFTQADGSTTRKYGGTGLGLAITKRLVELMGGKIWVESKKNNGSVFYFTLAMKVQKQERMRQFVPQAVLENTPVLVVEDNRYSRECIIKILQNFRMKPLAVENGEEAIYELKKAAVSGNPYPLMLLDISLGGKMDGFDVAETIKNDRELKDTNVIVISMSQKASDRERFALLGIEQFFTKPFSQSDLLDSIVNTLATNTKYPVLTKQNISMLIPVTGNTDQYKILLVEDNLVNQEVATSMLIKKGHTVVIANNGEEAISLFKKESFDLVLMDIQMPLLNGYEATQKIRLLENGTGRHTPVIGLTANAMKGDREKCLEAGMDEYVSKPVRFTDLIAALDRVKQKFNSIKEMKIEKPRLVNLDQFCKNLDGDTEIIENILEKFEPLALKYMKSIEENALLDNVSEIILPAHTIKGQCMHVEMNAVIELAGKIELLARENLLAELKPLIPVLRSALMDGLEELQNARIELKKLQVA